MLVNEERIGVCGTVKAARRTEEENIPQPTVGRLWIEVVGRIEVGTVGLRLVVGVLAKLVQRPVGCQQTQHENHHVPV